MEGVGERKDEIVGRERQRETERERERERESNFIQKKYIIMYM